jgi:hypothetical protein
MQLQLQTDKARYIFLDRIRCKVSRTYGQTTAVDGHAYRGFLINGQTVYYEESENRVGSRACGTTGITWGPSTR